MAGPGRIFSAWYRFAGIHNARNPAFCAQADQERRTCLTDPVLKSCNRRGVLRSTAAAMRIVYKAIANLIREHFQPVWQPSLVWQPSPGQIEGKPDNRPACPKNTHHIAVCILSCLSGLVRWLFGDFLLWPIYHDVCMCRVSFGTDKVSMVVFLVVNY